MSDKRQQTIFRNASADKPYAMILRDTLQDDTLSPEAGWVLMLMLSQPQDWTCNIKYVASKRRMGRDRVYGAIQELCAAGYCKRVQPRKKGGGAGPYQYWFTDLPGEFQSQLPEDKEAGGQLPEVQLPEVPETDLQEPYKGKTLQMKEEKKRESALSAFGLSAEWALPETWRSWAAKESPEHAGQIDGEAKKFKAHWRGKRRALSEAEWEAEWQKWFLRTTERAPIADAPSGKRAVVVCTVRDTSLPFAEEMRSAIARGVYKP